MSNSTLLLGKHTEKPIANTLFLGAEGTGAWFFMEENIRHQDTASMVIVDRKNCLYRSTVDTLKKKGYTVQVVDAREDIDEGIWDSYGNMVKNYNPFVFMKSDTSILNFAIILADIAAGPRRISSGSELFNFHAVKHTLVNYLMYLKENDSLDRLTVKTLYEEAVNGRLNAFMEEGTLKAIADSVVYNLVHVLSDFNDNTNASGKNTLNLMSALTKEKQVLFIEIENDMNDSTNLLYATLLEQLLRIRNEVNFSTVANKYTELLFFLNSEFPISLIPDFNEYMLIAKAKDIHFVMEAQAIERFLFADNMKYIVYGGYCSNNTATMEFLSRRAGTVRAKTALKLDAFDKKHVVPHRHFSLIKKKRTYDPQSFFRIPFIYEYIFEKEEFIVDEKLQY